MNKKLSLANIPRIKNKPFKKRQGDNLYKRDNSGHVEIFFGWFTPEQTLSRQKASQEIIDHMDNIIWGDS